MPVYSYNFNQMMQPRNHNYENLVSDIGKNDWYLFEMYTKYNVVAGGFLRIGFSNQSGYESTEYTSVSTSWGCNFLLTFDHENQIFNWYLVKNSFGFAGVTHSEESFCINGITNLMRFGSRKFMSMTDVIQNITSDFQVDEKNMISFLDKLVN